MRFVAAHRIDYQRVGLAAPSSTSIKHFVLTRGKEFGLARRWLPAIDPWAGPSA